MYSRCMGAAIVGLLLSPSVAAQDWISVRSFTTSTLTSADFIGGRFGVSAGWFGTAVFTQDGGFSWNMGQPSSDESSMAVCMLGPGSALVARNGVTRTDDYGRSWRAIEAVPYGSGIFDFLRLDNGRILMLRGLDIWASDDDAVNWSVKFHSDSTAGLFGVRFRFPSQDVGYAIGGRSLEGASVGHIAKTLDGGETWTFSSVNTRKIITGDFESIDRGLVAADDGTLYRTSDGAATFSATRNNLPARTIVTDLRYRAPLYLAVTNTGGILSSSDKGSTWISLYQDDAARSLNALSIRSTGAVAVGDDGLIVYENKVFEDGFGIGRTQ
jgi:photosystem II stability/assembly factor-like uncharacterized protein